MDSESETKEQLYKFRFENTRDNELELWLEPDGMCFPIPPHTDIKVMFSKSETEELIISFDKDNNFTLYAMSASVYQDNKLIYPDYSSRSNGEN